MGRLVATAPPLSNSLQVQAATRSLREQVASGATQAGAPELAAADAAAAAPAPGPASDGILIGVDEGAELLYGSESTPAEQGQSQNLSTLQKALRDGTRVRDGAPRASTRGPCCKPTACPCHMPASCSSTAAIVSGFASCQKPLQTSCDHRSGAGVGAVAAGGSQPTEAKLEACRRLRQVRQGKPKPALQGGSCWCCLVRRRGSHTGRRVGRKMLRGQASSMGRSIARARQAQDESGRPGIVGDCRGEREVKEGGASKNEPRMSSGVRSSRGQGIGMASVCGGVARRTRRLHAADAGSRSPLFGVLGSALGVELGRCSRLALRPGRALPLRLPRPLSSRFRR